MTHRNSEQEGSGRVWSGDEPQEADRMFVSHMPALHGGFEVCSTLREVHGDGQNQLSNRISQVC